MNFSYDFETETNAAEINVVPLLDITFTLIVFFMLTTTFFHAAGMDVNLPKSQNGTETGASPIDSVLTITSKGEIFSKDKLVVQEQLSDLFKSWKQNPAHSNTLIIWGDREAQHGTIVKVMDIAKTEGIDKIAIATDVGK